MTEEHSYAGQSDMFKRKYMEIDSKLNETQKDLRNTKDREKRARVTIGSLLQQVTLSENARKMSASYCDIPVDLFSKPHKEYSEDQKQFATTLYFYGPKAYHYLREKVNLPHPSTIRRWLSNISSKPGFSDQVFSTLKEKRQQCPSTYSNCSIMIDGMSIRRHIDYDPKTHSMTGFVDLGMGPIENDALEAREAIVILAVGLTGHWKIPLGYFLVDGISADIQSQLMLSAISSLHDIGIKAVSLIMDGHPTNQSMANILGCSLNPDNLISSFEHPNANGNVYVFFDACHLLKNFRGALHALREITEPSIGTAKWADIVRLEALQSEEGLRAANKLTKKHINFHNQKMKVNLAAQTLSNSVAKGLQFAANINCSGFQNCVGTVNFIKLIDQLFDIFNSRSPIAKGYKSPITPTNFDYKQAFLRKTLDILLGLKDMTGKNICYGKRKICVVGFCINILSLIELSKDLLLTESPCMRYLLTYKLSQDHLELLFSCIRGYGRWNNNPSAQQFSAAYRALLSHAGVSLSLNGNTNCIPQDITSILNIPDDTARPAILFTDALGEHDYFNTQQDLSLFVDGILEYISGWVVRKLTKKVECNECINALVSQVTNDTKSNSGGLLQLKNNGGLYVPSKDLVKIIKKCEITIRSNVNIKSVKPNEWQNALLVKILQDLPQNLFVHLNEHFINTTKGIDTHYTVLIKLICLEFIRLRRFHVVRLTNINIQAKSVRHVLTKSILFKNQ